MGRLLLALAVVLAPPAAASDGAPAWDAVSRVLTSRCLPCHGGDQARNGLRFATAETFHEGGARGPVFESEAPDRSRLLSVIGYGDPDLAMPPEGRLPQDEVELLTAWVLAGAPWPEDASGRLADPDAHPGPERERLLTEEDLDWWSYRPLRHVDAPVASNPAWNEHPVDAFVHARLDEQGLAPAPSAEPLTLLRRACFDLTGLPPTPEQVATFQADLERWPSVEVAFGRLVERLLESPAYGEHWARHWLDLVRYAATNGYERDATKTNAWRYRDWVIDAFNRDKPYDRFLVEQLAGDELAALAPELLPEPGAPDPRLATGYYRLGVWDDEPADKAQARADELADIVDTTGQVFLGATMGCARCHDHKADPIRQRDYYAFTAWFNNVTGYGGDAFGQHLGGGMTVDIADPSDAGLMTADERDARLVVLDDQLDGLAQQFRLAVGAAEESRPLLRDARVAPTRWRFHTGPAPDGWTSPGFDDTTWPVGPAGFGSEGTPGAVLGTLWDGPLIHLRTRFKLEQLPGSLVLSVHHDEDVAVWLNGVKVFEAQGYTTEYQEVQLPQQAVDALVTGSNVVAVACRQTGGGQFIDVGLRSGWLEQGRDAWRLRLEAEGEDVLPPLRWQRTRELLDERQRLLDQPVAEAYPALVVSEDGPEAPLQHVLLRGSAHAEGDPVAPAIPAAFLWGVDRGVRYPSLRAGRADLPPEGDPAHDPVVAALGLPPGPRLPDPSSLGETSGRRLALARWMVDDGAHLTARVLANRLWQRHFGRGLCRTPGDFGRLGDQPTHPELLDHLAVTLIEKGWSLKAMHRYLLSSRTWRMASQGTEAGRGDDPRNDGCHRAEPRRLTAEQYRDAVLAVSGQLNRQLGGPSVTPPLPQEVLATASRPDQAWGAATPEEASRRSLYVKVKRSLRPPLLAALDQPDPDLPCPERFPTNVPTQALMTLNGAFINEQAEHFARRLADEVPADDDGRVRRGILLALGRPADDGEVGRALAFLGELREVHGLLEEEAWAVWCLSLFNRNEFLWVD